MLAGRLQRLRRHNPRVDTEPLLEPRAQRSEQQKRLAEGAGQRLGRLLQIGERIALPLDMVAHPGFGGDEALLLASLGAFRRLPPVDQGRVEPRNRVGDRRRIVRHLEQFVARDADVGEHRMSEDLGELLHARALALGG